MSARTLAVRARREGEKFIWSVSLAGAFVLRPGALVVGFGAGRSGVARGALWPASHANGAKMSRAAPCEQPLSKKPVSTGLSRSGRKVWPISLTLTRQGAALTSHALF